MQTISRTALRPAKVMLEALWNNGEIVIAGRVSSRIVGLERVVR